MAIQHKLKIWTQLSLRFRITLDCIHKPNTLLPTFVFTLVTLCASVVGSVALEPSG